MLAKLRRSKHLIELIPLNDTMTLRQLARGAYRDGLRVTIQFTRVKKKRWRENWWPALIGFGIFKLVWILTYPVAVLPFRATCHEDLWGNEPPYSCLSYWCPHLPPDRLDDWPQCQGREGEK